MEIPAASNPTGSKVVLSKNTLQNPAGQKALTIKKVGHANEPANTNNTPSSNKIVLSAAKTLAP
jgi:hypothetical protein